MGSTGTVGNGATCGGAGGSIDIGGGAGGGIHGGGPGSIGPDEGASGISSSGWSKSVQGVHGDGVQCAGIVTTLILSSSSSTSGGTMEGAAGVSPGRSSCKDLEYQK